jgi:sigma-B regulation protein RsbU (phosphoserine phosphatase)
MSTNALPTDDAALRDRIRFFDLSLDLFCIASLEGFLLRVNCNFTRQFGFTEELLLSRPFIEFVHPDDRAATMAEVAKLAQGLPVISFRFRSIDTHCVYHWIEWTARSFLAEGKIFAVGRDIGVEIAMERELQARERREHDILNNTAAVVYVKGTDGRYQFVNQRFANLFEVDPVSVMGKTDMEIFPKETACVFQRNDQLVLETRSTLTIQEIAPHSDGPHTYISVKFPLLDGTGQIAALAGISTDITDQLRAREADEQMRFAHLFQQKLYPAQAPEMPGLDIAGGALPVSQVCGDYYDYIRRDGRLAVAVGDVSGHGFGPALQMVEVRAILRMLLRGTTDLQAAAEELNRILCADLPPSSFLSLFLCELDAEHRLRYIGAGHQGLLLPAGGGVVILDSTGGLMGLDDSTTFEPSAPIPLAAGDLLLVYTDGLTDVLNARDDVFGRRRVIEVIEDHRCEDAEIILGNLFSAVFAFSDGRPIEDDMTAVAVRVVE